MTLTLTPDTETRLRTMAEGYGLNPAELHEDLLQQALAAAELELNETLAELDESAEAVAAGRWITVDELDQRLTARIASIRAAKANAGQL
jgi:predicted transcriptional regulator